jgi:hypothetical protein
MPKFPEPPAGGLTLPAITKTIPAGAITWRIYFAGGSHPSTWNGFRFFGPLHARFDHHVPPPDLQTRGILYAADGATTCLAEVFQATRVVDRSTRSPWLVAFRLARDVELLDLTGVWPTKAGASMAINTGPRPRARRWSAAIYAAYAHVDGLFYASSMHANRPAFALYERAQSTMPATPVFHRPLADPSLLNRLAAAATRLGYGIV